MRFASCTLALALAAPLLAQAPKLPAGIENLSRKATHTAEVTLEGPLLKLAARFLDDHDSDQARAKKALAGIDGIYVRNFEFDTDTAYNEADLNQLREPYRAPEWLRIVGVRSAGRSDNVDVFFKVTKEGNLAGVAIVAVDARELTLVNVTGNIDPSQFMDLGGQFHIPRLEISPKEFRRMEP